MEKFCHFTKENIALKIFFSYAKNERKNSTAMTLIHESSKSVAQMTPDCLKRDFIGKNKSFTVKQP